VFLGDGNVACSQNQREDSEQSTTEHTWFHFLARIVAPIGFCRR